MLRRLMPWVLAIAGGGMLLGQWGRVADGTEALLRRERVRPRRVVYWTSSGSPEVDLKRAAQFMAVHPDVAVEPNFRETGGLQDMLFVSFLSGRPPDYLSARETELRKYILIGGVRPLDDLLAREGPAYFDGHLLGRARVHRLRANPDDRAFARGADGRFLRPQEAARLLALHGRTVGLRNVSMPSTLTYNKRLFREAARMFPEAGLVDAHGEPVPPRTWLEMHAAARWITEYGRRAAAERGLSEPLCHGVVLQGQRQADLMRGIRPLAFRAGSTAFHFAGGTNEVQRHLAGEAARRDLAGRPVGYFEYEHPSFLAAFALLHRLRRDGLVLPGTESRHYEDVRTALASGRAAMVIDGWHAALIGAERVPWAARDLGSAPVPVPWPDDPAAAGWDSARLARERTELRTLLALDRAGIEIPAGNPLPRNAESGIVFLTSLCRDPEAAWEWIHFASRSAEVMQAECRRGTIVLEREALRHLDDPEWFPFPYQRQVLDLIERDCAMWPNPPLHGPVRAATDQEVFYKWFNQDDLRDLADILPRAREELRAFSEAANRDLARRIEDGLERPGDWTFPDWAVARAPKFFERQQNPAADPDLAQRLGETRAALEREAAARPEWGLTDAGGRLRGDAWARASTGGGGALAGAPALLLALIAGWFVAVALRQARARRPLLREAGAEARRHWPGYVFVLPGLLAILAFALYPSLYQVRLALHRGDGLGPMTWVGAENFLRILRPGTPGFDSVFWSRVLPNTFAYMLVVTAGQLALGLLLASLLNLPLRANRVYRVLFFIPLVTSLATVSVILIGLLKGEQSGLNEFLRWIGLGDLPYRLGLVDRPGAAHDWLGPRTDLGTLMAVAIWHGLPYTIILMLAGLQSISPELYEAAKVDGAGAWGRFAHITLPEMAPLLAVIAFTSLVGAARAFSLVFVMTEGGVAHSSELVATYLFKWGFMRPDGREADLGYASALGIVYAAMLAVLTFANVAMIARRWRRRLADERRAARGAEVPA